MCEGACKVSVTGSLLTASWPGQVLMSPHPCTFPRVLWEKWLAPSGVAGLWKHFFFFGPTLCYFKKGKEGRQCLHLRL